MPTGMSDIPTQIYGSADFQTAIKQLYLDFADIFCREVKSEPARVDPLKVDIEWEKWRIPRNGGPPKEGGDAVTDRADDRAGSHRTLKIAVLQLYALGT
jgi:hypothetical protein